MQVMTRKINLQSNHEEELFDITEKVQNELDTTELTCGIVSVFAIGSTCSLATLEFEPGLVADFSQVMARFVPKDLDYEHHKTWLDDNGRSHLKASLLGQSLTIPFVDKKLVMGTWQQLIFIEWDTRPRKRTIVVQVLGQ